MNQANQLSFDFEATKHEYSSGYYRLLEAKRKLAESLQSFVVDMPKDMLSEAQKEEFINIPLSKLLT